MSSKRILCLAAALLSAAPLLSEVTVRREKLTLPTYKMGPEERNPTLMDFKLPGLEHFRGSRSVYPYTFLDRFTNNRVPVEYEAIILENEYVKAIIMPELRGRLQGAIDKRNGWDFLYYNHVIKPADIAVRAAWISGGLEWNHPGGHGYTQFSRISHTVYDAPGGGKTVLVAEIEPNRMMKWETAITLRPQSLAVETEGRFYSIAPYPVPFASSLNGAMHATDELEMIYPAGTWVTGHGKKYVEPWPNYNGTDHSWYKNLRHILSLFSEQSTADFFGCYSHDREAGTAVVVDHRTAPGKKYFTWGSAEDGRRWDTLLSDRDGPYIELQVGAFWENLGYGYAWLNPLEVKRYTVYWYPAKDLGGFVKANRAAILNVKPLDGNRVLLAVQANAPAEKMKLRLLAANRAVFEQTTDLSPAHTWRREIDLPAGVRFKDLRFELLDETGSTVMSYRTEVTRPPRPELPKQRQAPAASTMDELFHFGKSFYQDPFSPQAESYFLEMLRRDPDESRAHRELGVIALHRGEWGRAREHFERSLVNDPLDQGYRAQLYLGLIALEQDRLARARERFTIAARFGETKVQALYWLAVTAMREGHYAKAIGLLGEALDRGGYHPLLRSTLAAAHRLAGNAAKAAAARRQVLAEDPLDFHGQTEQWLSGNLTDEELHDLLDRREETFIGSQLYLEAALFYLRLGVPGDASRILSAARDHFGAGAYPMLAYYQAYCRRLAGQSAPLPAGERRDYVFPYRPPSVRVLRDAVKANPKDAAAWHYLGNLLYHLRRHEDAREAWKKSVGLDSANSVALRNLANVYWTEDHDAGRAIQALEQAIRIAPEDDRLYLELDHLYATTRHPAKRLAWLEANAEIVRKRDDLALRLARLYLQLGRCRNAAKVMDQTYFFPREKSRNVQTTFAAANYAVGEKLLKEGNAAEALRLFQKANTYPDHLSEGRPAGEVLARYHYLTGLAQDALGNSESAHKAWQAAAQGPVVERSEGVLWQARALVKLGRKAEADALLRSLLASLANRQDAVSLFVRAGAQEALGNAQAHEELLAKALELDPEVVLEARIQGAALPRE